MCNKVFIIIINETSIEFTTVAPSTAHQAIQKSQISPVDFQPYYLHHEAKN
jgi:hypothetical protein